MPKDQFKTRLEIAKSKILKKSTDSNKSSTSKLGIAFKISTEMVAAVVVGTIIGYILDNWFGTKPWLILIFFFVGVIAGILNVVRSAKNMQNKDLKKWQQTQCSNSIFIELDLKLNLVKLIYLSQTQAYLWLLVL